jgi:hypothetical protein
LILAVNCAQAAAICFCTSLGTGPKTDGGFDLALTELSGAFVVVVGTDRGAAILDGIPGRVETEQDRVAAARGRPRDGGADPQP